jgi:hypothetical protein
VLQLFHHLQVLIYITTNPQNRTPWYKTFTDRTYINPIK